MLPDSYRYITNYRRTMDKDSELFKGKTFADIMSDVYHNSKKKDKQIKLLIAQLEPLVTNINDATVVVPLIKEYMDVSIRML